jgi:methionine synthase II (cobalamin-independent)
MCGVEFRCLPTMIGSMPQTDSAEACSQVFQYLKEIPAWPQLPHRSFLENMYVQYSQGFPGVVVRDNKISVDRAADLDKALEQLYSAYLENAYSRYPITAEYAAGLNRFLSYAGTSVRAVKGQITGPVSWGMTVADSSGRAVAYDEVLADATAKLLKLKATWMEKELQKISKHTLVFLDEPYLHSIGSAFFALSQEKVVSLIQEVFSGIAGLKGIHCCGNTDWSVVLSTGLDILSFDTYNYAQSLALYSKEVKRFIDRGGVIAWGIVPNESVNLAKESVSSLLDRLEEAISPFTRKGADLPFKQLISQGLLTPSCSLAGLTPEAAGQTLELLVDLSNRVRSKWG